jgi:hypothetical protein
LFGTALSIFSNRLAIGAPGTSAYSNTSAAVYVYKRTAASWSNVSGFFLYDYEGGKAEITFGMSLCLNGKDLLVAAPGGNEYPNGSPSFSTAVSGAVYIYRNYTGDQFTKKQVLKANNPANADLFGQSVGVSNGNYIIANCKTNVDGLSNAGNVLLGYISN